MLLQNEAGKLHRHKLCDGSVLKTLQRLHCNVWSFLAFYAKHQFNKMIPLLWIQRSEDRDQGRSCVPSDTQFR